MKRIFFLLFSACLLVGAVCAQSYRQQVDSLVKQAVRESKIPGAVLCVVRGDKVEYLQAYGYRQVWPDTLPMTVGTQFDLASLSKVVGTGMSLMTLVDRGEVNIEDDIQKYLPAYRVYTDSLGEGGHPQRVVDFLTHTSGLPAYASYTALLREHPKATADERKALLLDYMATCTRLNPAGKTFRYSCLNFITLQYLVERVTGMPLDRYAQQYVFRPLGMTHTGYYPLGGRAKRMAVVAPTEKIAPCDTAAAVPSIIWLKNIYGKHPKPGCRQQVVLRNEDCYEAIVHDPLAREMNAGVSGNAGVFSTADDLAKLAIWMLNADAKNPQGKTIQKGPFSAETLRLMMTVPEGYEAFGRALAWDQSSDYAGCKGRYASASAVCHTGYTGTCMVVDPEKGVALILLTNRAHPEDGGGVAALRKAVADAVFEK